ncbi:hypothetical protein Tco_0206226 [Tanacetum coccineum]
MEVTAKQYTIMFSNTSPSSCKRSTEKRRKKEEEKNKAISIFYSVCPSGRLSFKLRGSVMNTIAPRVSALARRDRLGISAKGSCNAGSSTNVSILLFQSLSSHSMSRSSSSHTAYDASESGYTASLSRQPIQDSEEDPSEDEVNSIHSPTPTSTSVPSLPTRQGPRPDISRYPHMVTEVSVSHESGMTLKELNKMQYLCGEVRDCRIGVECQAELLLEMSDIVGRLTHQITSAIYTTQEAIVVGRRAWYFGLSAVVLVLALVLMVALMFVF